MLVSMAETRRFHHGLQLVSTCTAPPSSQLTSSNLKGFRFFRDPGPLDTKHLLITTSTLPKIAVEALMDRTSAEAPRVRVVENKHSTEI